MAEYTPQDRVPDFVLALERPVLDNPGVVARLKLRNPGLETPDRVLLTCWPSGQFGEVGRDSWDIPLKSFQDTRDSAAVMYWNPRLLKAGETRTVGFTYGLAHLAKGSGDLSASYNGDLSPGKKITVMALVAAPKDGETLTMSLPPDLKLIGGKQSQPVPASVANPSAVYWDISAGKTGSYKVTVNSDKGRSVQIPLSITAAGTFSDL
jgi:hypothetical protein